MGKLFEELKRDILYQHGMNACLNCGVCTAVCPAAEFNEYSPREVMNIGIGSINRGSRKKKKID